MTVQLLYTGSEKNRVSKTLTSILEVSGTLREETSILTPSIMIQTNLDTIIYKVNYMYIPDFNRYYFVTNITSIRNNLWRVDGRVDVLQTYRMGIETQTALLARQEKSDYQNPYLSDDSALVQNNAVIITKIFPNKIEEGNWSYLLLTIGSGGNLENTSEAGGETSEQSTNSNNETLPSSVEENEAD